MGRKKFLNFALLFFLFTIASGAWVYSSDYPDNIRNFVLICGVPVGIGTLVLLSDWIELHRKH